MVPETKPFYLTTEFWVHAAGQLLLWVGVLPTAGLPNGIKTVISFAGLIGYSVSRGLAKAGTSPVAALTTAVETAVAPAAPVEPDNTDPAAWATVRGLHPVTGQPTEPTA